MPLTQQRSSGVVVLVLLMTGCSAGGSPSAEPSASVVAPGSGLSATEDFTFPASATPGRDVLVGPFFALQVGKVLFTDRMTQEQAAAFRRNVLDRAKPMRAAPGQRLMVVETVAPTVAKAGLSAGGPASDEVQAVVRVGQENLRLPLSASELLQGKAFVMSVPAKGNPLLAVTDSGRTQSLDLVTGKRTADAIPGYYPVPRGDKVSFDFGGFVGIVPTGVSLSAARVTLQPYVPGKGWARKGRAWLLFTGKAHASAPPSPGKVGFGVRLSAAESFLLNGSIRGQGRVNAGPADDTGNGAIADMSFLFNVPAGFRTGVLRVLPRGEFTLNNRRVPWSPRQPAKTARIRLA